MKNIVSLLLLSFCFVSSTFSQTEFGIIAGPNFSNSRFINKSDFATGDGTQNQDYLLGFHAGLLLNLRLNDHFSIESNILYNQKGHSFTDQFTNESGKTLLHYISIPITTGYQFFPNTTIQLGPEISYLVSAKTKIGEVNQDVSEFYSKNISLSGLAGINYAFTDHLELGVRYIHGITRINQKTAITITDEQGSALGVIDIKAKTRTFQLSMRYKL